MKSMILAACLALGAGSSALAQGPSSLAAVRSDHSRAIDLAINGNAKGASAILERIVGLAPNGREKDRVLLSLGRVRFQDGDFQGAIDAYEQVEHRGSSWLESLEERAWAEMRLGRPQEAMARLQTVTLPSFKDQVRTEPFFLLALAKLRTCDYKNLFKTFETFKDRYKTPIAKWESSGSVEDKSRLREAGETIQKLNLVEAEAIQRIYIEEDGTRLSAPAKIVRGVNELSFPKLEGEELWADELDGYRVSVRGCPALSTNDIPSGLISANAGER